MQKLLNLLIPGVVTGGIYSIMASGIVLTYQTSGIFNFAHGAVAFTVAFVFYELHSGQGIPTVPAAVISVLVFAPLLGLLLDRILLRRLATAPVYARIVGTIGLLVALPALALWTVEALFGKALDFDILRISDRAAEGGVAPGLGPQPPHVFRLEWFGLHGVHVDSDQLAVFAAAAVSALLLWLVVRRTRIGLEMRLVVDRSSLASLRGIDPARTSATAWVLTMMLAGLGGILISPLFQLNDILYTLVVLGSLAAVVASGLRSIPVAFAAGLGLGVFQNLVAGYGDDFLPGFVNRLTGFKSSIPFILVLLLLGFVREPAADDAPARDHRAGLPAWRRRLPWVLTTLVLAAFTFQWIDAGWAQADIYEQGIIAKGLVFGIIFLSFVVVTGLGGMVSLAQATFVTAGGFTAGWALNRDWGINLPFVASHGQINFVLAAVLGALLAAVLGALVAIPVRRLGAVGLALGTFALAFVADFIAFGYQPIGKGSFGWFYRSPSLDIPVLNDVVDLLLPEHQDKLDLFQPAQQALLLLAVFGLLTLMIHFLVHSASGRAMLATRSSDVGARTSGIATGKHQLVVFALSAAIAGFGGVMLGMRNGALTSTNAPPLIGLVWLAVAVTFGVRRPGGALLAGLAFAGTNTVFTWIGNDVVTGVFKDLTTAPQFVPILFGLGAINLAKNPDGVLALIGHQQSERRLARERAARIAEAEADLQLSGATVPRPVTERPVEAAVAVAAAPAPVADGAGTGEASDAATGGLALSGIVAGYGEVEVLHGVDVEVAPGSVVALLGANGAGKSTLCAVAAGLVAPTSGRIVLQGEDVTDMSAWQRARRGVLLVPEARGIFPGLTVEDNLRVLLRSQDQRQLAYERFPILGERRRQAAGLMSGGEQQMLSLAPALAKPPRVLIADEPTLGLAPLASEVVVNAIRELREVGCAVLLVEEKAREVMQLADIVAFMELGHVVWMGPRAEADADRLAATYLGGRAD